MPTAPRPRQISVLLVASQLIVTITWTRSLAWRWLNSSASNKKYYEKICENCPSPILLEDCFLVGFRNSGRQHPRKIGPCPADSVAWTDHHFGHWPDSGSAILSSAPIDL